MENQETKKTMIYVLVAGIALVMAWEPWRPAPPDHSAPPAVGTNLFPKFTDPLAAKSLEIMKFDEATATIHPFKVAQANGVWSIPSHSNYPADAKDHMAEAATALMNVEILGVASTQQGDQELYGVLAPDPKTLRPGMTGVGTRVTLKDGKDAVLADLIIGKTVKEQPGTPPGLRYVREANRDPIYTVRIKTDRLTTKFDDWIEKDLLKLAAMDVRDVSLNDYSIEERPTPNGTMGLQIHPRSKTKLAFDDATSKWSLVEMSEFDEKGNAVPAKLADDEELNSEKLNGLKTALDDLQLVDVERKPKGLSEDLRASDEFVKDNEAQASLLTRGFYPVPVKDHVEMFSSEGEATCTTKDGVRYVLRFGRLAGGLEPSEEEGADPNKPEGEAKPKSDPSQNRYLFVMAQFDESQIKKPELQAVAGEKPADAEAQPADAPPEEKPAADAPAADAPAEKTPEAKPAAPKAEVPQTKTAQQSEAKDAAQADTQAAPPAEPKAAAPPEEKPADAAEPADAQTPAEPAADAEKKPAAPTPEEMQKVAVERENKRRQEEYDDAVKKGQDKVKELNDRFADWYFIISDDVYKKIHLGRGDIVQKKEAKQPESAVDSLGDPQIKDLNKGLTP
ncbi:MAG: DUF4340 domain-containing protein [Pirellulales bacterium]